MRPTVEATAEPVEPADDLVEGEEQGRGDDAPIAKSRSPRSKSKRPTSEPIKACKLHLPEPVFDSLHLTALKRKTTASAVAAEILRRHLPKLRIVDGSGETSAA
jgi:hypothetical protein